MAFGKARGNKRTSSSHASTITVLVFIGLCGIAVWMLSSNTFVPPQIMRVSTNDEPEPKTGEKQPAFEDKPGNLPEDVIRAIDEQRSQIEPKEKSEGEGREESSVTQVQETKQSDQRNEEENNQRDERVQESDSGEKKKVEQEQRDQREEDTGNQSDNTKGAQQDPQETMDQGGKKPEQEADPKTEVTFTDATKKDEPMEQQESPKDGEQTENTKNDEENGQQQEEPNTGNEENKVKDPEKEKQNEQDTGNETSEKDKGDEQNATEDGNGNQEEQNTGKDDTVTEEQVETREENQEGSKSSGFGSGIPKESEESHKSWKNQASVSQDEKQRVMGEKAWSLCNTTAGPDYIPCLDNEVALAKLRSRSHYEHRERHCPEDPPTCLVPIPEGYKESIKWPQSRDKIWYHNVPHTKLAEVKGHQNWVKVTGEFLTFPGGGTQFIHGALHYIDFLQKSLKSIAWGKHTRVVLDVGCGVASFGGFLFERDVLAMSFAPKDEHEAQVQFALERKIPAISAVMGTTRLPFPSIVFDLIHCARCRVPWHNEGGMLLLELNRMLRPGGYFVWSATPVYQKLEEDVEIWKAMSSLTKSLCWDLVTINKDKLNQVGAAIYRKPLTNECYEKRQHKEPPMCKNNDDPDAAWHVPLQACMHKVPTDSVKRGSKWPKDWPRRLKTAPYWLNSSQMGIYGKPAPQDFTTDYEHWKEVVTKVYKNDMGISWSNVRNVMDMRAVYGGFAAALKDLQVWVMNVVNINAPDTLPIIYERGLFGIYHDWCESFSTYPRSYDLLHADHLFSRLKARCNLAPVMAEVDRIVRPGGKLIVRDESNIIREVENMLKSLHWDVHLTFSKNQEGILSAQKGFWRPEM